MPHKWHIIYDMNNEGGEGSGRSSKPNMQLTIQKLVTILVSKTGNSNKCHSPTLGKINYKPAKVC